MALGAPGDQGANRVLECLASTLEYKKVGTNISSLNGQATFLQQIGVPSWG